MIFKDRKEAGQLLAKKLDNYKNEKNLIILGIPRGGIVLAYEISKFLNASLDIVVTRKIGHPANEELAVAAVDEDARIYQEEGTEFISETYLEGEAAKQKDEIKRRLKEYRGVEAHPNFKDKFCLIVDDGIATGLTTLSAINFVRERGARKVSLAIPVIPSDKVSYFREEVDELFFLDSPDIFLAVGQFYENFPQIEDEEVAQVLQK